jgi:hypothetical protein
MGYDIKCNAKEIKVSPGPSSYDVIKPDNLFVKASHNYGYNNGGLKKPDAITPKEELVIKYFGRKNSKSTKKNQSYFK